MRWTSFFLLILVGVVVGAGGSSCKGGSSSTPEEWQLCQTASDCPTGMECQLNTCIQTPGYRRDGGAVSNPDALPPDIQRPDVVLPEPPKPCQKNEDCNTGEFCTQNECRKGCRETKDCPTGQLCKQGICSPCQTDQDCGTGFLCNQGLCFQGNCQRNEDCQNGQVCKSNQCANCANDRECNASDLCLNGLCKQADCRLNSDCLGGKLCKNNVCSACLAGEDCGSGKLCINGVCTVATCQKNEDCPNGLLCIQNLCSPCASDALCGKGKLCIQNLCVTADCRDFSDCKGEQACKRNLCSPCTGDGDCPTGRLCIGDACKQATCRNESDCPAGKLCKGSQCSDCADDVACGAARLCINGSCVAGECRTNDQCVGGKICKGTSCVSCTQTSECDAGKVCDSGACKVGNCVQNSDCTGALSGKLCKANQCSDCTDNNDCTSPATCLAGRCLIGLVQNNNANQWADTKTAKDCAEYRFPPDGYVAATADGVYWIQPTGSSSAFQVHCNMTHAGGGWTNVLKIHGDKGTFDYASNLWVDQTPLNETSPDINNVTEAKLKSYWTVPVEEIMIQMSSISNPAPYRAVIVRKSASSFLGLMQQTANTSFDIPAGRIGWRMLHPDTTLQTQCPREGINLQGKSSSSLKVRMGFAEYSNGNCDYIDTYVGIGLTHGGWRTVAGNWSTGSGYDNGYQHIKLFARAYVRKLAPVSASLLQDSNGAKRYADGTSAESCLAYRLPPAASTQDGLYWISPKTAKAPFQVYCNMTYQGGGWTLALKQNGTQKTFAYDEPKWKEDKTHPPTPDPGFNDTEAKLESFSTVPFRQLLLMMRTNHDSSNASDLRYAILPKSSNSLLDIFKADTYAGFDYEVGLRVWRDLVGGGPSPWHCGQEGFNVKRSTGAGYARTRIGFTGDKDLNCNSPDYRIGMGSMGNDCSQNSDISAGISAKCSVNGSSREAFSFAFLWVR